MEYTRETPVVCMKCSKAPCKRNFLDKLKKYTDDFEHSVYPYVLEMEIRQLQHLHPHHSIPIRAVT